MESLFTWTAIVGGTVLVVQTVLTVLGVGMDELDVDPGLDLDHADAVHEHLLGALSLLVGARAEPGTLRVGATQGGVEALFRTSALADLESELRARGLVETADAARQALSDDDSFDMVLLDLALGEVDGFEVLAELREQAH